MLSQISREQGHFDKQKQSHHFDGSVFVYC